MIFKIKVNEEQIKEYFETIDWIKSKMIENKDDENVLDYYQTQLDEYEMNLANIEIGG